MSKVAITNHEGTRAVVSILRYGLATNDTTLILYSMIMMILGGFVTMALLMLFVAVTV